MIELKDYKRYFPTFTPPTDKSQEKYFDELVEKGAVSRYGEIDDALKVRIEEEKRVYKKLDYVNTVLVIADLINGLRADGVKFVTSGLQCSSVINYVLGITEIDPIKYGFIFERYINENAEYRNFYPNYYINADSENFGKIIKHIKSRYGKNSLLKLKATDDYFSNYLFGINFEELDIFEHKKNKRQCALSDADAERMGLFVFYLCNDKLLNILTGCKSKIKDELNFNIDYCFDVKTWEYLSSGRFINPEFKKKKVKDPDPVIEMVFKNRYRADLHNLEELSGFISVGGFNGYIPSERLIENFGKYKSIIPQEKVLYQEDYIMLIQKMTRRTFAECDKMRRQICRHNADEIQSEFIHDCVKNGYTEDYAKEIFGGLKKDARYIRTKTWTYIYAYHLYQLAYINVHYPEEYNSVVAKYEIV